MAKAGGESITPAPDCEGPLISGRPPLAAAEVQRWCRSAKGPPISDGAALHIALVLNVALALPDHWQDQYAKVRRSDPLRQRRQRVGDALRVLLVDLPGVISVVKEAGHDAAETEALLAAVQKHEAWAKSNITRGRPVSAEGNLAALIGRKITSIWEAEHLFRQTQAWRDKHRTLVTPRKAAIDAFVMQAMAWLGAPRQDAALARSRRRRTQFT